MSTLEILALAGWALTVLGGVCRILWGKEAKLTRIVELLTGKIELLPLHDGHSVHASRLTSQLKRSIECDSDDALDDVLAPFLRRAEATYDALERRRITDAAHHV